MRSTQNTGGEIIQQTLKIGITQRVEFISDRQERCDSLDQAWSSLLWKNRCIPVPLANPIPEVVEYVKSLGLGGIVLTGGNDIGDLGQSRYAAPERDTFEEKLIAFCVDTRIPLLGVCRGMQMLAQYFGGHVVPIGNHVRIPHPLHVYLEGKIPVENGTPVNSFHNFGVLQETVERQFYIVAKAQDGAVEAIVHREYPQWGVMWHPERENPDVTGSKIIQKLFFNWEMS